MKTNRDQCVKMAVNGNVDHPRMGHFYVGYDGKGRMPVGTGGIVYNYAVGDRCMGIAGDHVEPGVSLAHPSDRENHALETLACIGNQATILNGPAAGAIGYVSGTHGGVDHTMVCLEKEVLEKMTGNEQFIIKSFGQGLRLLDHEEIYVMNLDPDLLNVLPICESDSGIQFPVVTCIPGYLMGAGLGASTLMEGDYDIMTQDASANHQFGIDELRFGDFVAVMDHDCTYGPHYKKGAISIGVVVHSDSYTSGHGPGVTVVATCQATAIEPRIEKDANLKTYMPKVVRE